MNNSNTSQAFGFQTGTQSDKNGSLKVKLANLEVSIICLKQTLYNRILSRV